ncbi:OadG family protein [Alkaliphilus crotonatoxidans]
MSLLEKLHYATDSMTFGERLLASLQVTVLGVGIVFVALLLLYLVIQLMSNILAPRKALPQTKKPPVSPEVTEAAQEEPATDDGELVAVITAAVAASLHTSTHNIVVKNIVRRGHPTSPWANNGLHNLLRK